MSPFFTLGILKSPSNPVIVPLVVPFTTTEAPMIVSPFRSTTVPVQEVCCTTYKFIAFTSGIAIIPIGRPEKSKNALSDFKCSLAIDLSLID